MVVGAERTNRPGQREELRALEDDRIVASIHGPRLVSHHRISFPLYRLEDTSRSRAGATLGCAQVALKEMSHGCSFVNLRPELNYRMRPLYYSIALHEPIGNVMSQGSYVHYRKFARLSD